MKKLKQQFSKFKVINYMTLVLLLIAIAEQTLEKHSGHWIYEPTISKELKSRIKD